MLLQREANALAMQQKWSSLDEGRHLTLNLLSKEIELRNGEVKKQNLSASCLMYLLFAAAACRFMPLVHLSVPFSDRCLLLKFNSNKIMVPDFLNTLDQSLGFPL